MYITASMLRSFKTCPKRYYFEYIECLKTLETDENLITGTNYHACLEKILKGETVPVTDMPSAMAEAFDKYIPWRTWNVQPDDIEKQYEIKLAPGIHLKGKMDALCADGTPIEHKSSSEKPDEKYKERLFLDDQVSCYLLALSELRARPETKIIYTVCTKPKLKPSAKLYGEAQAEELLERQRAWFDEEKVQSFTVVRAAQEITDFKNELIYMVRSINSRKTWYRNPNACSRLPCPYKAICQDYDPTCTVGFTKKERKSEELENI